MDTTLISDTYHYKTLTFTNLTITSNYQKNLYITSQTLPTDAVAPPPVKPTVIPTSRAKSRARVRRKQKLKFPGDDSGGLDGGSNGGGGGGFFGGSGGGGNGGFGWDESESEKPVDPAFDFVYELLTWFVLSNCLYFAVKRVVRIVVDGSGDDGQRRFR